MGVGIEELGKLSNGEVVQMLRDCVWRAVKESWAVQAEQHSKLKVVNRAGGTGPVAPVLAGPIFEAPTIFLNKT